MKFEAFVHMAKQWAVNAMKSCNVDDPDDLVITITRKPKATQDDRHEDHPLNRNRTHETD
jgi:hypothetical protein